MIAAQSVNYVERFIIDEGHVAQRVESDYGYDLVMMTFDAHGYAEPGSVYLQLKASETLDEAGSAWVFDLDVADYNLWMREVMPVILILFDASRRRAYWLHVQRYFGEDPSRRPKKGAKTVRVHVPKGQPVSRRAVATMRTSKQELLSRFAGEKNHA